MLEYTLQKKCVDCQIYKDLICFHVNRATKDGLNIRCKECYCKKQQAWAKANRPRENERKKRWLKQKLKTPEGRRSQRKKDRKKYEAKTKRKVVKTPKPILGRTNRTTNVTPSKWTAEERLHLSRISEYCRESTHKGVPYTTRSKKYIWFGCTYEQLHSHLGVRPNGWELDHICPLSQARTVEEYILLQTYLNLRWVPAEVNWLKGANYSPAGEGLCLFLLGRPWLN